MAARSNIMVLSGGGLKSAVVAARCLADGHVIFVHVNYGQRSAAAEVQSLRTLATHFQTASPLELETPHALQIQQRLSGPDGPRAAASPTGVVGTHALSPSTLRGLFPVLLSIGAQAAWRIGAAKLLTGVSRLTDGAHLGLPGPETHPDYLREFIQDFTIATETFGLRSALTVEAPLADFTYDDFARLAVHLNVPIELTWSCLAGGHEPCGLCLGCTTRGRALATAGAPEPVTV